MVVNGMNRIKLIDSFADGDGPKRMASGRKSGKNKSPLEVLAETLNSVEEERRTAL